MLRSKREVYGDKRLIRKTEYFLSRGLVREVRRGRMGLGLGGKGTGGEGQWGRGEKGEGLAVYDWYFFFSFSPPPFSTTSLSPLSLFSSSHFACLPSDFSSLNPAQPKSAQLSSASNPKTKPRANCYPAGSDKRTGPWLRFPGCPFSEMLSAGLDCSYRAVQPW